MLMLLMSQWCCLICTLFITVCQLDVVCAVTYTCVQSVFTLMHLDPLIWPSVLSCMFFVYWFKSSFSLNKLWSSPVCCPVYILIQIILQSQVIRVSTLLFQDPLIQSVCCPVCCLYIDSNHPSVSGNQNAYLTVSGFSDPVLCAVLYVSTLPIPATQPQDSACCTWNGQHNLYTSLFFV